MNIFVTGLNHKTTPLSMRERFSFSEQQQREALKAFLSIPSVKECTLISTCNRTEVYAFSEDEDFQNELLEKTLCELKELNIFNCKKFFYNYSGRKAARHLFKVASGLDSMVLGEDQILGQVKASHELAKECGATSVVLNTLFRDAVTAAKKVKTCTELSKNSISIASLAVKVVSDIFEGQLENKKILVIGAGKIGSLVLKNLGDKNAGMIFVTSRSHGKKVGQQKNYDNLIYIDYKDRYSVVDGCDVVISSTTSPHYTITEDMLKSCLKTNKTRAFVDLAVPRDIDEGIKALCGVVYLNMDDLELEAGRNVGKRAAEAAKAEEIISEFAGEYEKWYEFRKVLPIVKEVQGLVDAILEDRIKQTLSRLKCASEEDLDVVKSSMTGTVKEIFNKLVYSVRECSSSEDMETYFKCLRNVVNSEGR